VVNRDAAAGAIPALEQRLRYRLNLSYAIELCVQAVDTLYPLLGGRGLIATDPVQRAWRDVHAVSQHIALVWDVTGGLYGAVRLGFPCADPKI
jgi:3-hydroxy-9,10-secoandrosta-1,3,5(10)-triene-9,17-dione monooxygenase